ncbi:SAM-dependent methyltransferase [Dokdonella sp. MW10]|uniref:SAM-dependent methyltransferase n=1 Tax=Dokdonella sp. MW10 TaxID=2992926 RepID=UPI003F82300F
MVSTLADYFDALYRIEDPFGYRGRWYEQRKRELLLAMLPRERFARGWEIGCSNGELTAQLGTRCDSLFGTDVSAAAAALARARVQALPHVQIFHSSQPSEWMEGEFDLIVLSEMGYYLDAPAMATLAGRVATSLVKDGVLVACHWLHAFEAAPLLGDEVHDHLILTHGEPAIRYRDHDVRLDVWDLSTSSIAEREGLR